MIYRPVSGFPLLALVLAVPSLALLAFLGYLLVSLLPQPLTPDPSPRRGEGNKAKDKRIVLIVDDVGYNDSILGQLTSLPVQLNFAVIPSTPNARRTAQKLAGDGFEVLCHIPMEPLGSSPTESDTILTSMTDEQIRAQTRRLVRAMPQARGVNNHMGSRATRDRRVMTQLMTVLKEEGLYFVDSVTTAETVGPEVAKSVGVRTASRHIFLDHEPNDRSIRRQMQALAALSEKQGLAIGIAHPHATTVRVLSEELPRLKAKGFRFVSAATAVH